MSGNRYLLDTNAIIALLQGDSNLIKLIIVNFKLDRPRGFGVKLILFGLTIKKQI
jgi:hypothetical protein